MSEFENIQLEHNAGVARDSTGEEYINCWYQADFEHYIEELSSTKEKLNEALESNKAVWKELESVDYAGSMDEAVRYLKRENAELRKQLESLNDLHH